MSLNVVTLYAIILQKNTYFATGGTAVNITFLIGNGFDIGLGLKTRYENFYDVYSTPNEEDSEHLQVFKSALRKYQSEKDQKKGKIVDWADFEKTFGAYSKNFKDGEQYKYIELFENFVEEFNAYLQQEENKVDYSNKKLIADTMKEGVTKYFYIRKEDTEIIQNRYNSLRGERIYNFVSFNYTKTIDSCADILKESLKNDGNRKVGGVFHIHGYVEENMIMGIDNPSQISNPVFVNDLDIIREIVKPEQNKEAKTNYEKGVVSTINASHIICIYGMSIGETDRKWWTAISKWLVSDPNRLLVVLGHDDKYDKRFAHSQRKVVTSLVDKFLDNTDLDDNQKEKIRDRVLVGMNYDIFSMKLRKNEETPVKEPALV